MCVQLCSVPVSNGSAPRISRFLLVCHQAAAQGAPRGRGTGDGWGGQNAPECGTNAQDASPNVQDVNAVSDTPVEAGRDGRDWIDAKRRSSLETTEARFDWVMGGSDPGAGWVGQPCICMCHQAACPLLATMIHLRLVWALLPRANGLWAGSVGSAPGSIDSATGTVDSVPGTIECFSGIWVPCTPDLSMKIPRNME